MRVVLISFLFSIQHAEAQYKPQYSLYMMNNYLINPAISGIEDYADIKLGYRNQWSGIEGAPETYYLSGHVSLGKTAHVEQRNQPRTLNQMDNSRNRYRSRKAHHGLGGMVLADNAGPFRKLEANLSYAYHLPVSADVNVAMGISGGIVQQTLRTDEIVFTNPDDFVIGNGDIDRLSPDLSLGTWIYSKNFYAGLSAKQLLRSATNFGGTSEAYDAPQNIHYFLTGAYRYNLSPDISAVPSFLVKYLQSSPLTYDVNLLVSYMDRISAGISYRNTTDLVFMARFSINYTLEVGYAFDHGSSQNAYLNNNSHEVVLGIRLKNKMKVLCPQNLW